MNYLEVNYVGDTEVGMAGFPLTLPEGGNWVFGMPRIVRKGETGERPDQGGTQMIMAAKSLKRKWSGTSRGGCRDERWKRQG